MAARQTKSRYSRIWAAVKAVGLSKDELYQLVERDYGVDSLTKLNDEQVMQLGNHLWDMANGHKYYPAATPSAQRTDEGGNSATVKQRKKIYMLATSMGWSAKDIDAFAKKQYGVDSHKWLSPKQCSDIIDALNDMSTRPSKKQAVQ